jgi:ATP-binding cassette subfamily F protein 3
VALAGLLLDKPNVLLLDEPTNHLDIASCEALEAALAGFPGTILCVSHDRFFLQKVTRRLLILRPPDVIDFDGRFSDWAARQESLASAPAVRKEPKPETTARPPPTKTPKPVKDNPYKRPFGRLTVAELEAEIHACETSIVELQSRFADPLAMRDPSMARRLSTELEQATERLRQLEAEYFTREA